jgi:flagellar protein FlbD
MIKLTRLSRASVILNSDLIEHIEETPDTLITLTSGQKLMVLESAEDIVSKVIEFRSALVGRLSCALVHSGPHATFVQGPSVNGRD